VIVEIRPGLRIVSFEITFDDGSHGIREYGLHPIPGQGNSLQVRPTYRC
jgi:hypothetical protein